MKELRTRLETAKSTQQLTSAMKMVSVSKLRKAQGRTARVREMCFRLMSIYREMSQGDEAGIKHFLLHQGYGKVEKVLVVVIGSDKGMCGTFNTMVCRAAEEHIRQDYASLSRSDIMLCCIGNKVAQYFASKGYATFPGLGNLSAGDLDYSRLAAWMPALIQAFQSGRIQKADVVYCRPVNAATQQVRVQGLLPVSGIMKLDEETIEEIRKHGESSASVFSVQAARRRASYFRPGMVEVMPGKEAVLEAMLPKVALLYLYLAVCQSATAEHGARMTAMSQATDNAEELIKELNLRCNKLRQSGITNELIEIVSGATAQL